VLIGMTGTRRNFHDQRGVGNSTSLMYINLDGDNTFPSVNDLVEQLLVTNNNMMSLTSPPCPL
jgi:hypothetical protein